ncbi:MAG: hypothetical protein PF484_04170 [Bacteroidales bacterium]|nr:hypothetical protein [Bacteroidales bacterium]
MNHYTLIAELFRYPDTSLESSVKQIQSLLVEKYADGLKEIIPFQEFLSAYNLPQQQEYYIKTFDVNALCYLDIGFILFGEDYKRGEFLVKLSQEHKKAENDCGSELADHLPNLLRLLDKSEDKEFVEELAYCLIIPALKAMLVSFKNESNVYRNVIQLVIVFLEKDFQNSTIKQFHISTADKDCFTGKASQKNHACGMNQRTHQGMVANPLQ